MRTSDSVLREPVRLLLTGDAQLGGTRSRSIRVARFPYTRENHVKKRSQRTIVVEEDVCYWIWRGNRIRGKWVPDPVAAMLGLTCGKGSECVNPNKLKHKIKGKKDDELLIMPCKHLGVLGACDSLDCYCSWTWDGSRWQVQHDYCSSCGNSCQCIDPNTYRRKLDIAAGTSRVTFCEMA
jgi:hypothetical protein